MKDNASTKRFRPFGHAMLGVANENSRIQNCTAAMNCEGVMPSPSFSSTGLAGAFGGGLDIKIDEKIQFRAIQLDYNPIRQNRMTHNGRVSVGIAF